MRHALTALALMLAATGHTRANPPIDALKDGRCLELKVDGQATPCNDDLRFVDDGQGEVSLTTGYGHGRDGQRTIMALFTRQAPDLENAYGYALRVEAVTLMPSGQPDRQRRWPATGLCFLVKPNPVRAGTRAVQQDIVVLCSANFNDPAAPVRRIDWKFVL